jgi:hypothetical protein
MDESGFERPVEQRTADAYLVHLRKRAAVANAADRRILQPRIDSHLDVYQAAVDDLARTHALLIDQSDLDLRSYTRSVVVWELVGRAISLAHALIDQLRRGYGPQTVGTTRLMYEAASLLEAISEAPEEIARKWLDGDHIPMREARKHLIALAMRSSQEAAAAGSAVETNPAYQAIVVEIEATPEYRDFIEKRRGPDGTAPEGIAAIVEYISREEYGELSHQRGGHNDRSGLTFARDIALKQFVYGPHPDPHVLAKCVEDAGHDIQRVVIVVGYCFAFFFLGADYQKNVIVSLQDSFERVRDEQPLLASDS